VLPLASTDPTALPYPQSTYALSPITTTPSSGAVNPTNAGTTGAPTAPYPWDGTQGKGICGVLIYQTSDDTAADNIIEGTNDTINGVIYTPNAALNVTGSGSLSAAENGNGATGTFGLITNSINMNGSGSINISTDGASGTQIGSNSTTTTQALLTQ
jgi:hypothetical protein